MSAKSPKKMAKDLEDLCNVGKHAADMSYKEWHNKFVVDKYGGQKAETFQKMIKNKASDKK